MEKGKYHYTTIEKGFSVEDRYCFKKVYDFLKKEGVDTKLLEKRLKTLKMVKITKRGDVCTNYDHKTNKLIYITEEDLYHETFHIATKGIVLKTKEGITLGKGLNEGITDLYTKKANKNSPINYKFEKICADLIEKAYGKEIYIPYFQGNGIKFRKQFNEELISYLIEDLDEYTKKIKSYYKNIELGKSVVGKNTEIAKSFYYVLNDLKELLRNNSKLSTKEITSYLEKELFSSSLSSIREIIETGDGRTIDIKKCFE